MPDDPEQTPAALAQRLRTLVVRLRRRLQDESTAPGLSAPQASALARLVTGEPSSASLLAGAERVRPQSMATTLAALFEQGLIRREADPDDARRQLIFLTEQGREIARGARSHRVEWLAESFERAFTDDERRVIEHALTLLERVVDDDPRRSSSGGAG